MVLLITISVFLFAITSCSKRKVEAEPSVIGDISLGENCIIGAGSVVLSDVPPKAI